MVFAVDLWLPGCMSEKESEMKDYSVGRWKTRAAACTVNEGVPGPEERVLSPD